MPLFEFNCAKCSHQFEVLIRKPTEEKELTCPECSSKDITKLFSTFGMTGVEKGGGSSSSCTSCSSGSCSTCNH